MTEVAAERRKGWRGIHYRMYDWVLKWAAHKHAQTALFVISFAEASFFPVPPDVLLIAMSVAKVKKAMRYALICSVASILGGMLGYVIGLVFWELVSDLFYRWVPGFTPEVYEKVAGLYDRYSFWIVFAAGFTPIPYKVFTICAGVAQINFPVFLLASAIGRSARFFLVAGLIRLLGPRVLPFVEKYLGWLTVAFVVLLLLGFVLIGRIGH
jgi:membrane protein YqaA with SNARE-associated domain